MSPNEIARLDLPPGIASIPRHCRTRDTQFLTRLIPMPSIQNLTFVNEHRQLHTMLADVLDQRSEIGLAQVRKQLRDGMSCQRLVHRLARIAYRRWGVCNCLYLGV